MVTNLPLVVTLVGAMVSLVGAMVTLVGAMVTQINFRKHVTPLDQHPFTLTHERWFLMDTFPLLRLGR